MLWTSYPIKITHHRFKELLETKLHILLSGPPGIGKSTLIYGYKDIYKIIELNASNDRGIATVRNRIKDLTTHKQKLILMIDEADYMTIDAQSALRKLFELNTNTKLILTCNDKSRLIAPIRSRMYEIKLEKNLTYQIFKEQGFSKLENSFNDEILSLSYWYFEGDKRAVLNFLQARGVLELENQKRLVRTFQNENSLEFLKMFKRIGQFDVFKKIFVFCSFPPFRTLKRASLDGVKSITDAYISCLSSFEQFDVSYEFISNLCITDFIEELLMYK